MFVRKGTTCHRKNSRRNSLQVPGASRRASIASTTSAAGSRRPSASPSLSPSVTPNTLRTSASANVFASSTRDLSPGAPLTRRVSDAGGRRSVSPRNSLTPPTSAGYQHPTSPGRPKSPSLTGSGAEVAINAFLSIQDAQRKSPRASPRGSPRGTPRTSPRASPRTSPRPSLAVPKTDEERRRSSTAICMDDKRRLFEGMSEVQGHKSYGSIIYQMKEANLDSSGIFDLFLRTYKIIWNTIFVTILLMALVILKLVMLVIGIQNLGHCPKEPNIPIYLLVGGVFGLVKVGTWLWRQIRSRRYEPLHDGFVSGGMDVEDFGIFTTKNIADFVLSTFLLIWFGFGNYWVLSISDNIRYKPLLYEPSNWCDRTVFVFSIIYFAICYASFAFLLLVTALSVCCTKIFLGQRR